MVVKSGAGRSQHTFLPASGTPTSMRRVPHSDDILLLWNQVSSEERKWGFGRHRLTTAVSSDGGRTWRHRRNLESLNDRTYIPPKEAGPGGNPAGRVTSKDAVILKLKELGLSETGIRVAEYSSLLFVGDKAVITYDVGGPLLSPGVSLRLRVLVSPLSAVASRYSSSILAYTASKTRGASGAIACRSARSPFRS